MDIKSLIGLIKKPKTPLEELERALQDIDIPAAEQRVEALERQRREMLLSGSNDEVAALDVKIRDANLDVERLAAMHETLTKRIADMKSQGAEEARRKAFAAASRTYGAGKEALEEYEKHAKAIAAVIGKLAELEQVVDVANADLPEGAARLPGVEIKLRGLAGEPAREVKREVIGTAWFHENAFVPSAEISESMLQGAKLEGNTGTIMDYSRSGAGMPFKVRRCQVVKITTRDSVDVLNAHALAGSVSLPGVLPGSHPIWGDAESHSRDWARTDYNRATVIEDAAAAAASGNALRDPRPEPILRNELKIVPLGDDAQAAD